MNSLIFNFVLSATVTIFILNFSKFDEQNNANTFRIEKRFLNFIEKLHYECDFFNANRILNYTIIKHDIRFSFVS